MLKMHCPITFTAELISPAFHQSHHILDFWGIYLFMCFILSPIYYKIQCLLLQICSTEEKLAFL